MTRRQAVVALAAMVAAITETVHAQGVTSSTGSIQWKGWEQHVSKLKFDLRAFGPYEFSLDGKSVSFTPEELFAALQPCQHEALSWGPDSFFAVNGRKLDVCRKCGLTFWRQEAQR